MKEDNSIGLYSLNCKVLGNEKKRRQVFRFLGKKNPIFYHVLTGNSFYEIS